MSISTKLKYALAKKAAQLEADLAAQEQVMLTTTAHLKTLRTISHRDYTRAIIKMRKLLQSYDLSLLEDALEASATVHPTENGVTLYFRAYHPFTDTQEIEKLLNTTIGDSVINLSATVGQVTITIS